MRWSRAAVATARCSSIPDSGGVHIVEHKDEVVFAGERGGVRHIYLDGRPHPNGWVPTGAGHSVGRYEGDVLVVETVG